MSATYSSQYIFHNPRYAGKNTQIDKHADAPYDNYRKRRHRIINNHFQHFERMTPPKRKRIREKRIREIEGYLRRYHHQHNPHSELHNHQYWMYTLMARQFFIPGIIGIKRISHSVYI